MRVSSHWRTWRKSDCRRTNWKEVFHQRFRIWSCLKSCEKTDRLITTVTVMMPTFSIQQLIYSKNFLCILWFVSGMLEKTECQVIFLPKIFKTWTTSRYCEQNHSSWFLIEDKLYILRTLFTQTGTFMRMNFQDICLILTKINSSLCEFCFALEWYVIAVSWPNNNNNNNLVKQKCRT